MPIALVGAPTTGSAINGGDIALSLPTTLQDDVVYVGFSYQGSGGGGGHAGWTQVGSTVTNGNINFRVFRKVMGASPDTSVSLSGSGSAADSSSAIAIAFRGVNTTTPEDGVTPTTATGTSTNPDCPTITPTTTGDIAIAFAGTAVIDTTGTGAPAGYSDFTQISSNDNNDTTSYLSWKSGLTGGVAEDPGAYTGVSSAAWGALTIVVKPAPPGGGFPFMSDPFLPMLVR